MLLPTFVIVCLGAFPFVESGQCCRSYYDAVGQYHDAKWCDKYCCFELAKYDCCDQSILAAGDDMTDSFCAEWFGKHVWAPILIVVVGLAIIIGCITCCCCCCCACCKRNQAPSTIIVNPTPQAHVVAMSNTADPRYYGYDQD